MGASSGRLEDRSVIDVPERTLSDLRSAVEGQITLVTGGGAGIGAAISRALSSLGATVVIADLDADRSRQTAQSTPSPEATFAHTVDVSNPDQVQELIESVTTRFGRIDLLVNNAGVAPVAALEVASLESWRQTFAVNVEGAMFAMQCAARAMLLQEPLEQTGCRGKFVNISSPAAEIGRPLLAAYGASKAALNHLSKSAAASWGDRGIATTIVYPGNVKDAMWPGLSVDIAAAEGRSVPEIIKERIAWTPSGKLQEPAAVADAVTFIAGFQGCGLNGQIVWTEPHVSPA
jgi:NAD(P)-dependent dehydrogenase (short-subunit alcohol dehydrogenase family)